MSTPPSYGSQPGPAGGQYPGQAANPYAGTPAQQPNPYAAAPAGAQPQAYPAPPYGQPQPQPGQQPYPGQQQPYQDQQPYPNQQQPYPGQQPFPGQQPQQPQQAGWQVPPPSTPSKASRFSRKLAIRLGVLVVLGVIAFAWSQFNGDPSTAKVGDCVQNKGTDANPDVHVIGCSDPKALYKVLKTASGSNDSVCDNVTGTVVAYTESGSDNLTLCLGNNKPTG